LKLIDWLFSSILTRLHLHIYSKFTYAIVKFTSSKVVKEVIHKVIHVFLFLAFYFVVEKNIYYLSI